MISILGMFWLIGRYSIEPTNGHLVWCWLTEVFFYICLTEVIKKS